MSTWKPNNDRRKIPTIFRNSIGYSVLREHDEVEWRAVLFRNDGTFAVALTNLAAQAAAHPHDTASIISIVQIPGF